MPTDNIAEETDAMAMAHDTVRWTLEQLHALPDDGNKYELVRGELFVTPSPSPAHESLASIFGRILHEYVGRQAIGRVYHPRAVVRHSGSEVEPDLVVRPVKPGPPPEWDDAPTPLLVVEILSPTTRRRDHVQKRAFYVEDAGVFEYWIVDGERREVCVIRRGADDTVTSGELLWHPGAATEPLVVDLPAIFEEALGP